MAKSGKASGIQPAGQVAGAPLENKGGSLESLSPHLVAEVQASLERCLRLHKAETIGRAVNRKHATVYAWVGRPHDITVSAAEHFVEFDSDADYPLRMAAHWMEIARRRALLRSALGQIAVAVQTVFPVRASDEAIRRATGRSDLGDD